MAISNANISICCITLQNVSCICVQINMPFSLLLQTTSIWMTQSPQWVSPPVSPLLPTTNQREGYGMGCLPLVTPAAQLCLKTAVKHWLGSLFIREVKFPPQKAKGCQSSGLFTALSSRLWYYPCNPSSYIAIVALWDCVIPLIPSETQQAAFCQSYTIRNHTQQLLSIDNAQGQTNLSMENISRVQLYSMPTTVLVHGQCRIWPFHEYQPKFTLTLYNVMHIITYNCSFVKHNTDCSVTETNGQNTGPPSINRMKTIEIEKPHSQPPQKIVHHIINTPKWRGRGPGQPGGEFRGRGSWGGLSVVESISC